MPKLPPTPLFDEWTAVQRDALRIESELMHRQLAHARGEGAPPQPVLVERAQQLRARASLLLPQALAEMEAIARSLQVPPQFQVGRGTGAESRGDSA